MSPPLFSLHTSAVHRGCVLTPTSTSTPTRLDADHSGHSLKTRGVFSGEVTELHITSCCIFHVKALQWPSVVTTEQIPEETLDELCDYVCCVSFDRKYKKKKKKTLTFAILCHGMNGRKTYFYSMCIQTISVCEGH